MGSREEIKVENYCKQLKDFDVGVRRFAIKKLFELNSPISIPHLIDALSDSDILVRTNAENTLIGIGPVNLEQIFEGLLNIDPEVRLRLLNVYKHFKILNGSNNIIPFIEDRDKDVSTIAISIFRNFLDQPTSELIWKLVANKSKSIELRGIYYDLLEKNLIGIEQVLINDLKKEDIDDFAIESACKLYLKLEPTGHSFFVDKINSGLAEYKIASLISIANHDQNRIISEALRLIDDEDANVRKSAVRMLGLHGNEQHLETLIDLKNTPSKGVWQIAKSAIEEIELRLEK